MSGGEVVCSGWLRKSPPEKKLKRYVSALFHSRSALLLPFPLLPRRGSPLASRSGPARPGLPARSLPAGPGGADEPPSRPPPRFGRDCCPVRPAGLPDPLFFFLFYFFPPFFCPLPLSPPQKKRRGGGRRAVRCFCPAFIAFPRESGEGRGAEFFRLPFGSGLGIYVFLNVNTCRAGA